MIYSNCDFEKNDKLKLSVIKFKVKESFCKNVNHSFFSKFTFKITYAK